MKKLMVVLVLLIMVAFGCWYIVQHPYFHIATVTIDSDNGQEFKRVDQVAIFEAVRQPLTGSLFTVDLQKAREIALMQPWVKQVRIERIVPHSIKISVIEQEPAAYWIQAGYRAGFIATDGEVFQISPDIVVTEPLPELEGAYGTQMKMLQQYHLFEDKLRSFRLSIKRLKYTNRAAWSLMLDNGVEVRLGKEDVLERLNRFIHLWQSELFQHANEVDYVDMRYPHGAAVKYHHHAVLSNSDND